ncbi:unnamed protein product [Prorocentrum cordatum]|uniref:Secreted protein n=1 Tax=Prorocentrum cordatum TaxID=2364126 RepID=A0ABN9SZA8_9DINO|nr:unnamed protein product [Polarella glacialis]
MHVRFAPDVFTAACQFVILMLLILLTLLPPSIAGFPSSFLFPGFSCKCFATWRDSACMMYQGNFPFVAFFFLLHVLRQLAWQRVYSISKQFLPCYPSFLAPLARARPGGLKECDDTR